MGFELSRFELESTRGLLQSLSATEVRKYMNHKSNFRSLRDGMPRLNTPGSSGNTIPIPQTGSPGVSISGWNFAQHSENAQASLKNTILLVPYVLEHISVCPKVRKTQTSRCTSLEDVLLEGMLISSPTTRKSPICDIGEADLLGCSGTTHRHFCLNLC